MRIEIFTFILFFSLQLQIGFSQNHELIDSLRSEKLYEKVIIFLEDKEKTLSENLELTTLNDDNYKNIEDYFESIGMVYKEIYRYQFLRKRYTEYLKKTAIKFVNKNQPLLIIYGNNSRILSKQANQKGNNLNIQFIGIHDYQKNNQHNFGSEIDIKPNSSFVLYPTKMLDNFLLISAIEKFNENIIEELEQKYEIDEVLEILKWYR